MTNDGHPLHSFWTASVGARGGLKSRLPTAVTSFIARVEQSGGMVLGSKNDAMRSRPFMGAFLRTRLPSRAGRSDKGAWHFIAASLPTR